MCWMTWLSDGSDIIAKNASTIHTGAAEGGRAGGGEGRERHEITVTVLLNNLNIRIRANGRCFLLSPAH